MSNDLKERLIQAFHSSLWQGESYARIHQARKQAEEILGAAIPPGSPLTKVVDEAIEAAIVRVAPLLIAQSSTTHQAYDHLVDLLNRQPTLGVRSSTSILQQAYSTPIPIAYLASTLAGITPKTTVYEPTAGNGALLIGADPANVIANELNDDRLAELKQRGYRQLTQHDASKYRPAEQVDVVITNPPFGVVHEDSKVKRFEIPGNSRRTRQIDHAIAFRALECLKDNGRAVLILGGKLGQDEVERSERYNSIESRGFFHALYQQYNVTQHLSIWGDLYRKQGAGFPIDLILIKGRGQSQRDLPAADVPLIYKSFDALKELLPNEPIQQHNLPGIQQLSLSLEAQEEGDQSLFLVKIPNSLTQLTWREYQRLLMLRIQWMLHRWLEQSSEDQTQTHRRLTQALRMLSLQEPPNLYEDYETKELEPLWWWTQEWAETFVERNETLATKFQLTNGLTFPVIFSPIVPGTTATTTPTTLIAGFYFD